MELSSNHVVAAMQNSTLDEVETAEPCDLL